MARQPDSFLVRILRDDDDRRRVPEGAGVLVRGNHILTCAHVVKSVVQTLQDPVYFDFPLLRRGSPLKARIAGIFPESVIPSPDTPEDLCILEAVSDVPGDASPAPLLVPEGDTRGRSLMMFGFPKGMDEGDWIEGEAKGRTARGFLQFHHKLTSGTVDKGFSGAPAWDEAEKVVAGLVVAKTQRDGRVAGYLIPASTLVKAWPELLPKKSSVRGSAARWMCDRNREDIDFFKFFDQGCRECRSRPQIYVIPGREDACHMSLIQRLRAMRVSSLVEALGKSVGPRLQPAPWPTDGEDVEERREILCDKLFNSLDPDYRGDHSVSGFLDLCRRMDLKKHEVVMLVHDIDAEKWDSTAEAFLVWYLTEFWGAVSCVDDLPFFLVFLNFLYPTPGDRGWMDWLRWKLICERRVNKSLKLIREKASCPCLIFEELKEVERHHLREWFISQAELDLSEKEKQRALVEVFKKRNRVSMADVEAYLETFVGRINREISGLHS
jgi:hypothetical protein